MGMAGIFRNGIVTRHKESKQHFVVVGAQDLFAKNGNSGNFIGTDLYLLELDNTLTITGPPTSTVVTVYEKLNPLSIVNYMPLEEHPISEITRGTIFEINNEKFIITCIFDETKRGNLLSLYRHSRCIMYYQPWNSNNGNGNSNILILNERGFPFRIVQQINLEHISSFQDLPPQMPYVQKLSYLEQNH